MWTQITVKRLDYKKKTDEKRPPVPVCYLNVLLTWLQNIME